MSDARDREGSEEDAMFAALVKSMCVEQADPLVAKALAEYARRYVGELLISAKDYCNRRGEREKINEADVRLAMTLSNERINGREVSVLSVHFATSLYFPLHYYNNVTLICGS